ncbi:NfeD family protein [Euzebya sp.]|uniref:NfeD family protein n=1 Tax=Euzebya sp. TaxID=1971409 RepID=UPI00351858DE
MPLPRLVGGVLLVLGLLAGIAAPTLLQPEPALAAEQTPQDTVDVVEVVGVLDAPLTDFTIGALETAAEEGSEAVVIRLDTPGALGGDIDALVDAIDRSPVPVVVYVGPPGAQALGAGVRVAAAAHVLALAPATTFGVAVPQDLGDPDALDVAATAALLRDLAEDRGRDPAFADAAAAGDAVVAVPDGEAGTAVAEDADLGSEVDPDRVRTLDEPALVDAGIADVVEPTLQGVLSRLSDLEVETAAGPTPLDVDPVTANVRFVNANLLVRILHTAASPTLAYLLLLVGLLTLAFEIFQPGFGVAGFSAIGLLGLGVYSLVPLPFAPLWVVVAIVGLLLLAYDLAVAGLSWPTAVGTLLLGAGSWWMWAVPELAPPLWLVIVGTLSATFFFVIVMTTVLRAQGNTAQLGAEHVEGKVGVVRSVLNPEGHIFVGGALWRARAPEEAGRVKTGTRVRVLGLNDKLTLDVSPVDDEADVSH